MSLHMAFGVTEEDVETVLRANEAVLADRGARTIGEMAEDLFDGLDAMDFNRIAGAALDAGVELEEQTDAAHEELRCIFVENGIFAG